MAYKEKAIASEQVDGSFKDQFKRIYDYANELLARNPRSTMKVKVEDGGSGPIFKRFYCCLKACKDNFVSCRPIIGLDGAFLKGRYGGELLTVVGRDANDQMLPLAYAVVEVENKDTWKWFLELLVEDLGGEEVSSSFTLMSDQQKLKRLMWKAASATQPQAWELEMRNIKQLNDEAFKYLLKIPPSWSAEKLFEVRHVSQAGDRFVVNLDEHSCTCRKWAISGVPCCHSLTAMKFLNLQREEFIPCCFRKTTHEETYTPIVYPINGQNMWEITPYVDVLPPPKRIMPGRPKKKRRLEQWELVKDDNRMTKGGIKKRCAICKQLGHNKTSCTQSTEPMMSSTNEDEVAL
ncbi:uncharacterized protein LOC106770102 [Vigna radiata var. radiata]|uniref:Uncharacterized protein LOC106770102 n=1 Tax=Vigna radiata var. radiata TaxID=3916 RepID=A0A1S3UZD6_VIGRR|nr:uncharacterized protein LOC106770102 [Vigna radiata var. radiata]